MVALVDNKGTITTQDEDSKTLSDIQTRRQNSQMFAGARSSQLTSGSVWQRAVNRQPGSLGYS